MRIRNVAARRSAVAQSAFTLIELLLVLVILSVLAAVVVPKFGGKSQQAKKAAAQSDIASLETALDTFEVDCGRYPAQEEGLGALLDAPANVKAWKGPYVKRPPKDPWGNEYIYRFPGQVNQTSYDLLSMGEDGKEGTDDDINNFGTQEK